MTTWGSDLSKLLVLGIILHMGIPAHAEAPAAGNLLGHRGTLRAAAAQNHKAGWVGIGTDFQYFTASGYLAGNEDHARMINSFSIAFAPLRFLEAAVAMHVTSDRSATSGAAGAFSEDLMVAVGDPEISLKGGVELGGGVSLGGLFDLRFPSGAGFFESAFSSTSFLIALLASWSPGSLPLGVHLNFGFQFDGTENLFEDPAKLKPYQRYAAQVSSFHRLVTRLGVDYNTTYVGPFVELSLEPFIGGGAPGFGDSPGMLSFGARAWPTKSKNLQLLAALDVGITGVAQGDDTGKGLDPNKYAFVIPRWNLVLRLSYRFDAYAKPATRVATTGDGSGSVDEPKVEAPQTGAISGAVMDGKTNKPLWNARVSVAGQESSQLAVDANGTFRTYQLPTGTQTIVATADGYGEAKVEVQVAPDGTAETTIKLMPKTSIVPGTIRGTIKAITGRSPRRSTILIPALDKTIKVGKSGEFTVKLKAGEYKVVVSAKGFRTQTKKIRVQEGSTVILNVDLHR
jgi:Carboxypeptidase regulatory-like domain